MFGEKEHVFASNNRHHSHSGSGQRKFILILQTPKRACSVTPCELSLLPSWRLRGREIHTAAATIIAVVRLHHTRRRSKCFRGGAVDVDAPGRSEGSTRNRQVQYCFNEKVLPYSCSIKVSLSPSLPGSWV